MISGKTKAPNIVQGNDYVIIGSVDHGMSIPLESIPKLVGSLAGCVVLVMETPESMHQHMQAMSAEILTKVSMGSQPVHYLPGNDFNEDIGGHLLRYVSKELLGLYVACLYVRIISQEGGRLEIDKLIRFIALYKTRMSFLETEEVLEIYRKVSEYWRQNGRNVSELNEFSYDFEKFVGDIREYELWKSEIRKIQQQYAGKIAICVGSYHVPFVGAVLADEDTPEPNWSTHIDTRREDLDTPQDADTLKTIYMHIDRALGIN